MNSSKILVVCLISEINTYFKNIKNDNALSLFHFLCGDACWDFFDQYGVSRQLAPWKTNPFKHRKITIRENILLQSLMFEKKSFPIFFKFRNVLLPILLNSSRKASITLTSSSVSFSSSGGLRMQDLNCLPSLLS